MCIRGKNSLVYNKDRTTASVRSSLKHGVSLLTLEYVAKFTSITEQNRSPS